MKIHMERLTFRDEQGNAHTKRGSSYFGILEKLAQYEDLEEQGLLLKLPCKEGDTIYWIKKIRKTHWEEERIVVDDEGEWKVYEQTFRPVFIYDVLKELGKTIFLTEQEAQSALEKMRGE